MKHGFTHVTPLWLILHLISWNLVAILFNIFPAARYSWICDSTFPSMSTNYLGMPMDKIDIADSWGKFPKRESNLAYQVLLESSKNEFQGNQMGIRQCICDLWQAIYQNRAFWSAIRRQSTLQRLDTLGQRDQDRNNQMRKEQAK